MTFLRKSCGCEKYVVSDHIRKKKSKKKRRKRKRGKNYILENIHIRGLALYKLKI